MSGGLGIWGGTPWGGSPLSVPSTLTGVVKLPPVNVEPGALIQFPAAPAALNGTVVTSPFVLDEPGYYELFVETTPVIIQPFTVVDLNKLKVQVNGFGFTNDGLQSYVNMASKLPRTYGRGPKSLPRYQGSNYCLDVIVNAPVTLLTRLINRAGVVAEQGRTLAPVAGRYRSAPFDMTPGQSKVQAVVQVEATPFIVTSQSTTLINNPFASPTITTPASAVGFVAPNPPSATTISNDIAKDKNAYTAFGVGSYANNYQAVQRLVYVAVPLTYVIMSGFESAGTFKMGSMVGVTTAGGIEHVCIARNVSTIPAYVTPIILHAFSGMVKFGQPWILPPDNVWYKPRTTWTANPFTNQPWYPADIGSDAYRFGLFRDPSGGTINWEALVVAPQGTI